VAEVSLFALLGFARRWWLLLVLGPLVAGAAGYVLVAQVAPVYQANATAVVNRGNVSSTSTQDPGAAESLARTYAEALKTRPVLEGAAQRVGLPASAAHDLLQALTVRSVTGTDLLRLTVEDRDPATAAALTNAVLDVFSEQNLAMQTGRFSSSRQNLEQLVATLRGELDSRSAELQQARTSLPAGDPQLSRLETEFTQLQATYSESVRSYESLRVAEAQGLNGLTVVEPAVPPTDPVRPNKAQSVALALLAGLLVALATAALIEYLDDGLQTRERLVTNTGLVPLGSIPRWQTAHGGLLARTAGAGSADRDTRRAEESYRLMFSSLMIASGEAEQQPKALMITSAAIDEGKSLTAANLAAVLAEAGRRVILVDADLHRPSQMRLFKLPDSAGLSTLLLNTNSSIDSLLRETMIPGLRVLTAGAAPAAASALFTNRNLGVSLAQLRDRCDVLVVDTPPVLARPDAALLGPYFDGILFVVDAQRSRGRQVRRALELLNQSGAHILGAVFNRVPSQAMDYVEYNDEPIRDTDPEGSPSQAGVANKPAPGRAS
jgi:polysaccharide biosynthesis transport protein